MHVIVAHFLRDGDELHAILRELADIELKLEMIAEEAGVAVDDHEVERRRFRRPGLDKPLELWTAVVRRRRAGLNIGVNELEATRRAPAFDLPPLVGDRYVMTGLHSGRDAKEEGRARPWD